jgi:hypothetical protein
LFSGSWLPALHAWPKRSLLVTPKGLPFRSVFSCFA